MKYLNQILIIALGFCYGCSISLLAQIHNADGNTTRRGNRLISVKSEVGKELYQPERTFFERYIIADGIMSESEWNDALVISPFLNEQGRKEQTSVRLLYDRAHIYLYWEIREEGGITATMTKFDSVITNDDYI
jgi:hypothetical protein